MCASEREFNDESVVRISRLLDQFAIDTSRWGMNGAKTIEDLVAEIAAGESLLEECGGELVRVTTSLGVDVFVRIYGKTYLLKEKVQVFADGYERRRNLSTSLGEKLLPGEDIIAAVRRALKEELGVDLIDDLSIGDEEFMERQSNSYPGLKTHITIQHAAVEISPSQFVAEGYVERQLTKTTYFVWCSESSPV